MSVRVGGGTDREMYVCMSQVEISAGDLSIRGEG